MTNLSKKNLLRRFLQIFVGTLHTKNHWHLALEILYKRLSDVMTFNTLLSLLFFLFCNLTLTDSLNFIFFSLLHNSHLIDGFSLNIHYIIIIIHHLISKTTKRLSIFFLKYTQKTSIVSTNSIVKIIPEFTKIKKKNLKLEFFYTQNRS